MLSWQELELFWRQLERRGTGKKQVLRVRRRAVRTTRSSVVMTRGRPHAKRPIRKIYTKRDHKPPIAGKRMSTREDQIMYQGPSKSWPDFIFFGVHHRFQNDFLLKNDDMYSAAVNVCLF